MIGEAAAPGGPLKAHLARRRAVTAKMLNPADTSWFVHDRFGMFIHWGSYALGARHEWLKKREKMTAERYGRYFDHFDPDLYDPKAWARAAANAGMKYFVVTSKHHEGFCLWDSEYTDYKATRTPCGKDLLAPMVEAFREEGLKVGFYYSLLDWHHPDYPVDRCHPQAEDSEFREKTKGRDVSKYAEYMRNQVRELLTRFGKIDIMWFDFSFPGEDGKGRDDWESRKLFDLVRELAPEVLIDNRLDLPGSGDFVTPEQFVPEKGMTDEDGNPVVWEGCQTFSGSWGYHRDESTWKSVEMLVQMLIDHVSKNGNMLLNVGPTARGEFDARALDRLQGIGEWMRRHSRSVYGCGASEFDPPRDCRYTQNGKKLYLHLFAWPFKSIHLPGLAGKVEYAQLLNDGSEIFFRDASTEAKHKSKTPEGAVSLDIPTVRPEVSVPVVEIFLK
jgi:alpha-L-fucosidase